MSENLDKWRRLGRVQPTDSPALVDKREVLRTMQRFTIGAFVGDVVLAAVAGVSYAMHNAVVADRAAIMLVPAVGMAAFCVRGAGEARDAVIELQTTPAAVDPSLQSPAPDEVPGETHEQSGAAAVAISN